MGYSHTLQLEGCKQTQASPFSSEKEEVSFLRIEALSMLWLVSLRIC